VESIVVLGQVPDPAAGLVVDGAGTGLDPDRTAWITNPFDECALEEALLLKELLGGTVTVVALDDPEVDQALYRAVALGAGRTVKLVGAGGAWFDAHRRAATLASWLRTQRYDLILTGVQSPRDLDGQVAVLLAGLLGLPHASVVVGTEAEDGRLFVTQEFGGGRLGVLDLALPAILGIQVSLRDPRYVSEMRVRLASMGGGVQEVPVEPVLAGGSGLTIRRLHPPEATRRAAMLEGTAGEVADAVLGLLRSRGLIG
jgi:electron transfer flavoprotein beta subunit